MSPDDRGSIPGKDNDGIFTLRVQTISGAQPASYSVGTGGNVAEARR